MFIASCYDRRHHGEDIRRLVNLLAVQVQQRVIPFREAIRRAIEMGVPTDAITRAVDQLGPQTFH